MWRPSSGLLLFLACAIIGVSLASAMPAPVAAAGASLAQNSEKGAPVDLKDLNELVPPGSSVLIAGTTTSDGKAVKASLKVTKPNGQTVSIAISLDANGAFSHPFSDTSEVGIYKFQVTAPDGNGIASGQFQVAPVEDIIDAIEDTYGQIGTTVEQITTHLDQRIADLPPSPPRDELRQKLSALSRRMRELESKESLVRAMNQNIGPFVRQVPNPGRAIASELGDWAVEAEQEMEEIRQKIEDQREAPTTCDSIEVFNEGLAFYSSVNNLIGGLFSIVKNVVIDKVGPAAVDRIPFTEPNVDGKKLLTSEVWKTSAACAEGIETVYKGVPGLIGDCVQLAGKKLFSAYCEKLEGPISADYEAKHVLTNGKVWWRHKLRLEGKMTLWYEKDKPINKETGIELRGRIEGNCTKVEFEENILLVEPKPLTGQIVVYKRIRPNVVTRSIADEPLGFGQTMHRALPGVFNIRYEGRLKDKTLQLHQQEAGVDFSPLFMNRLLLVGTDAALPIPVVKVFNFPIEKAKFILGRCTTVDPILPVTTEGGKVKAEKTFDRVAPFGDGGLSSVTWKVSMKVETAS